MPRKPKFKPEITRVKLNPEQAVLSCSCYNAGGVASPGAYGQGGFFPLGGCHVFPSRSFGGFYICDSFSPPIGQGAGFSASASSS